MTTDYRAMCAELVDALENARRIIDGADGTLHINTAEFVLRRARALLAQPEPEGPVGPTDDEIYKLALEGDFLVDVGDGFSCMVQDKVGFARAVLARWGHPTPHTPAAGEVAVSERLPGPEDCLDEGWAWFFNKRIGWRQAVLPVSPGYTHWLPANSLPTPEAKP
jgi:hypothetical protein